MNETPIRGIDRNSNDDEVPVQVDKVTGAVLVEGGIKAEAPIAPASFLGSAVLPASGGWTAATPFATPAGLRRVGFFVDYTGGSASGQVRYRVRKGVSASRLASEQVVDSTIVPSPPEGAQAVYDQVFDRPVTGTTATRFPVDVDVEGGWTHVVLDLAELGDTANPGVAAITLVGSY